MGLEEKWEWESGSFSDRKSFEPRGSESPKWPTSTGEIFKVGARRQTIYSTRPRVGGTPAAKNAQGEAKGQELLGIIYFEMRYSLTPVSGTL